ncbi:MAG: beta strand repeat-containing protein [Oscillospiraceae bacterium]
MNKTRMGKRAASLLLSLVMMLSLLPTAAYAAMADGVETQGAIVSENGTGVSDDSNSSGGTDDLQVKDSEGNGDTGDRQVGGSSVSGTADDTTGAEGGADPTDSVNGNDSADPQDDGDAVLPVASSVVSTSEELVAAIAAASDGDTITLGAGEFTTVGNTSPEKSLTFVGAGTGTVWTIGDLDKDVGGEGNGDYSFEGCDTITFKNMTLKVDNKNYRGFIRINNTVVENCTLEGRTAYWGYETAKFVGSTFNAPGDDYALWDYSTKAMSFDSCTFNISGKGVHVYVEAANADKDVTRTVAVNNCTVNSDKANKAFLNIKNSTQAYDVTLSGTNTVNGLTANGTTGSALYQVETTEVTETTGKPVAVKAKADDGTVTTLYEVKETVEASVAEVNGAKYDSLQAAVDAAKSGATVTLLADTRENVTIDKMMTLDLNGHTLNGGQVKAKPALTVTARVTVKDSSAAKTGTIMREDTAENSGVSSHYVIDIQGKGWLTFESGIVKNDSGNDNGKGASLVRVGDDSIAKYPGLNIKGGTFTQDNFIVIKVDSGDLFLNGGTLNSANSYAIEDWHRATIKGGTVNGEVAAWTYSDGHNSDLTISGGTVNGNVASVSYDKAEGKLAKVSISGGTVDGTLGTYTYGNGLIPINDATKATIAVTGGTFSSDPTQYVVEDSGVTKNDDGTYGVAKAYLAKVGDTSYYTMDEAFKAQTTSGKAIVLLRDYTTGSTFNSGSIARTVDLNGHTWTCTGTDANSAAFEINYPDASLTVKNGKVFSSQLVGLIPSAMGGTIKYDNSSLVFEGVEMTTTARSGIETNGNNTNDTVTLRNSTLNVPNGFGIYFPSSGTLTIDNSVINAKTMGVQVCAGGLNISGAGTAITVSGDGIDKTINDGAIEDGAAISIVERTGYKGLTNIEVKGGTFTAKGDNAAVKAYKWENQTASAFDNSENVVAISGGTFSSAVDKSLCADGYIPTQNADGTYSVKVGKYVAEIGSQGYESLQAAIDAAQDGQTVTLLADAAEDVVISKSITLDLGGKTLTNTNVGKATISVQSGTVTVKNGNVVGGNDYYNIEAKKDANLTLTDVTATAGNTGSSMIDNWGTLTITSGTYTGGLNVVKSEEGSKLTITGGTFTLDYATNGYTGVIFAYGDTTISGGEFIQNLTTTGRWNHPTVILTGVVEGYTAITRVTGGHFVNKMSGESIFRGVGKATSDNFKVSGGTFNKSISDAYCADGFIPTKNADGTYGVKEGKFVAEVGSTGYETFDEAIAAANASTKSATIYLRENITVDHQLVINNAKGKTITLNLEGFTLTSTYAIDKAIKNGSYALVNNTPLTIKNGTFAAGQARAIGALATLTLNKATVTQQLTGGHACVAFCADGKTYTIKDSTIEGAYAVCSFADNATIAITGSTLTGTGNTLYHNGSNYGLKLTVKDTTITSSGSCGVYISGSTSAQSNAGNQNGAGGYQQATFTGCTISGALNGVEVKYTDLTLDGCTVSTTAKDASYKQDNNGPAGSGFAVVSTDNAMNNVTPKPEGTIIIKGTGKYTGPVGLGSLKSVKETYADFADETIKISGGTFTTEVPAAYCADGFIPTKNADGTYGVKEGKFVAEVGSTKYETLAEAIAAAQEGQTVTLLADVADCGSLTISKNITLDGSGHTISGNSSISVNMPGNAAADVTIRNVNFKDIANGNKLSAFYFSQVNGKLTITGCTFDSIEYEAIQVTPMEGAEVNVSNNVFKAKADGTQVRHIHIEMAYGSGFDCEGQNIKLTVTDNQLHGTVSGDASMGIWWVGTDSTLKVDGNYMEHPETVSITLSNGGVHYNRGDLIYPARSQADVDVDDLMPAVIVADKASGESKIKAYSTLAEAVAAAQDGQTVRLLADVTLDAQIATGKAITIDGQSKYTIKAVKKLVSADNKAGMFYRTQSAKGTLTFLNVTLDGGGFSKIFLNEGGAGETVFDGVTSTNGGGIAYGSGIHISGGGSHATIRNSTLTGSTGTMELNDANYYAANDLWVGGNVYVTVENSVIGTVFVNSAPSATATNGVVHGQLTITGESTKITYLSGEEEAADKLDKFGNNGSLVKIDSGYVEKVFDKGSYAISGGTFKTEVKKEWCAAGYVPTQNGDGTYGVEVGKFTVMVTSRTTGSDSPVANVTGGGSDITYAQGTTVTASAISGYKFVGWFVNEYTGTPYSTDLSCEVKPTDDWTMIAVYEPISGGKFWLTVTASEFTVNGGAVQDSYLYEQFAVGASVTVNFTGSENFLYWVNASNKVVSTEKSYTFIMGSETTLKAVYGKARQNQATVVFISHSDQIISSKAYTTSDTIQFPVPPIKMGCTFTGWSMTEAEIRAAMANNSGIIQVRARYTEPSIACTVTVVYPEGTDNQVVNAVVGKAIDVTAKDIEGKTFSYWTDDKGTVLGYTKTLKLAPSGDMTVKAVYDEAAEAKPVITMSEVSATTANESYVVTFMATRAVPNGYKVVKQGILWSRDAVCGEDGAAAYMQFDSNGKLPDGVKAYIGNNLDLNGVTRYDIITKYNDRTFYGRGYMVLESDAGELLYIYTNTIASGSYDSLTK